MKTIKSVVLFLVCFIVLGNVKSQNTNNEPVVFTINGKQKVYLGEFERQFLKNLNLNDKKVTSKDIDDYLKLYVKFKLKIQDASDAGKDTAESYKQELAMYREQLSKNYLYDRAVTQGLIEEAYERLQSEIKVSHILIMCNRDASESDVAKATKRINEVYASLKRNPSADNFAEYAKTDSEDPGTKNSGGSLGYMTALQVVYEFENQAYKTPIGQISEPFRTDFGFHIVRVEEKRKNRGDIKVKHILIRVGTNAENTDEASKKKVDEIYAKLKSGEEKFDVMARAYSEDYSSKYNGGEMEYVNNTQYVGDIDRQNWIDKAYELQNIGDMTTPFRSSFGWHILQKVGIKPIGTFDQMKNTLKNQVQQNQRSQISVDALVEKVKKEENYKLNKEAFDFLVKSLDTNFLNGNFKVEMLPAKYTKIKDAAAKKKETVSFDFPKMEMFNFAGESFTVEEFAMHLNSKKKITSSIKEAVESKLNNWVKDVAVNYQNNHLEEKSVEFRDIYQEYREGILMFNRMQEKVWDLANNDSVGLAKYFDQHKSEYTWGDRFDLEVYYSSSEKMSKQVMKEAKKGISADSMKKIHTKVKQLDFDYRIGKYQATDTYLFPQPDVLNKIFATPEYKTAKNKIFKLGQFQNDFVVIKVKEFLPSGPKLLEETRGPVASKYQEELETQWLKELEGKYNVLVNQAVIEAFKQKLGAQ
jgi:peptidyl-prolyl cis-trans isomerase SurA